MRPDKAAVRQLLEWAGHDVELSEHELLEDVDGLPLAVEEIATAGYFNIPSLEQLGWTQTEYDDPAITE